MSKAKKNSKIQVLTALSVYLGLLLVGASPQVLAQAKTVQNSQPHSFEIHVKTNSVFSKLKYKSSFENKDLLPFAVSGVLRHGAVDGFSGTTLGGLEISYASINAENNQTQIVSNFPRASL